METIVALSTSKELSPIHIIRLSGSRTYEIINKVSSNEITKKGYEIQHTKLIDEDVVVDDVLLMKFIAPKSFTGEDLIEINCHGNYLISQKIINLLLKNGAVLAEPGEFSKRALLNNKMNAVQLFAMNNLIHSTNDTGIKYSLNTMLSKEVSMLDQLEEGLFHIIGRIEVLIDYPEFNEDTEEEITNDFLIKYLTKISKIFDDLIHDAKIIIPYYNGINIVLVGVANAGKSSLLNKLINKDKAIVTSIPGTTRDVVEEYINVNNSLWKLQDTAGIRQTNNSIENIGILKSKEAINNAHLILFVVDGSTKQYYEQEKEIFDLIKNKNYLIVLNKADLKKQTTWEGISISTFDNSYKQLFKFIEQKLNNLKPDQLINNYTLQDQKQLNLAIDIKDKINKIIYTLSSGLSFDLVIDDLHRLLFKIQELIGKTNDVNFIDRLFANFCVGK